LVTFLKNTSIENSIAYGNLITQRAQTVEETHSSYCVTNINYGPSGQQQTYLGNSDDNIMEVNICEF
jgi:hypothetical protein